MDRNEAELIRRVGAGEKEAFYELVRPYERAVYTAAMSILNNQADAEEVAQEAVLKAFLTWRDSAGSEIQHLAHPDHN